jgi:hypothetical protein
MMEEALTALLLGDADLTALIDDRVHWMRLPAGVSGYPYLNLQVISDPEEYLVSGALKRHVSRVQCDFWAESYGDVKVAARAGRALLSGYRGRVSGVVFQRIFLTSAGDLLGTTTGGERQLFRVPVDLSISWFQEN